MAVLQKPGAVTESREAAYGRATRGELQKLHLLQDPQSASPLSSDSSQRPALGSGRNVIRGVVSSFQQRSESWGQGGQMQVWSFRIVSYDGRGNLTNQAMVESRGRAMQGSLRDGDEVEVDGEAGSDGAYGPRIRLLHYAADQR